MTGNPDKPLTIDTHHHLLPDFFWQATENAHAPVGGLAPLRRDLAVDSKQRILRSSELSDSEGRAILGGNASGLFSRRFRASRNVI
jgi:hypothetical protein